MRKGQATGEFVIAFTAILIIFLGVLALLNEYFWNTDRMDLKEIEQFLDEFQGKIDLAVLSDGTVRMAVDIPHALAGRTYNISVTDDGSLGMTLVEVYFDDYDRIRSTRFVPIFRNNTDLNGRGAYTLVKNSTGLFLIR